MDRNKVSVLRFFMTSIGIAILVLAESAAAATITVNASGGAMFTKIQDAINASNNSDTISVAPGMYNENVFVNKSINLTGAGANVTIINASDPDGSVIYVSQQNRANINGFTVTGGTGGGHTSRSAGIYLSMTNNTNLSNNNISNNYYGIYLFSSINANLSYNKINSNNWGIYLLLSSRNRITGNVIALNSNYGISLSSSNNTIYNNYFNNTNNSINGSSGANIWNTSKQNVPNIAGGSNLGGNFWGNLSGTGFSQTCMDADLDGICDSSFVLDTGNEDFLALAVPTGYINGSIKYNNTGIADAIVTTNTSVSANTDVSGFYSFRLPAGSYRLTASGEPKYYPGSSIDAAVVIGTTITMDFNLTEKPTANITGVVSG